MQAPNEEPLIVSEPLKSTVSIPETYTQYRDEAIAGAKTITEVAYPNDAQLSIAVASLRELTGIEKQVGEVEESHRKPVNAWLKMLRRTRDEFLDGVIREKVRLTGLVNHFQTKAREAQLLRDKEAAQAVAKAQKDAADAQHEIERQQQLAASAKTDKAREAAEDALLAAQLQQETAALSAQNAEAALATPTNTPKGLVTKVRYDFEIIGPMSCITNFSSCWLWHRETETFKFDRAGFLKQLNAETKNATHELLPDEGEQSVTHQANGLRIFLDIRTSTRA